MNMVTHLKLLDIVILPVIFGLAPSAGLYVDVSRYFCTQLKEQTHSIFELGLCCRKHASFEVALAVYA